MHCDSRDRKELDTTERLDCTELMSIQQYGEVIHVLWSPDLTKAQFLHL